MNTEWHLFEIGLAKHPNLTRGQVFRSHLCPQLYGQTFKVLRDEGFKAGIVYCASKAQARYLKGELGAKAGHFNSVVSKDVRNKNQERFQKGEIQFLLVIDLPLTKEVSKGVDGIILRRFSIYHRVHEIVKKRGHTDLYDFGANADVVNTDVGSSESTGGENHPIIQGDQGGWVRPMYSFKVEKWDVEAALRELCRVQGWRFVPSRSGNKRKSVQV
jgi:hypothetical protein